MNAIEIACQSLGRIWVSKTLNLREADIPQILADQEKIL